MAVIENGNNKFLLQVSFAKVMIIAHCFGPSFGQFDPLYVAVLGSPVATKEKPTVIDVYRGDATVEFDKAILLGNSDENHRLGYRNNNPRVPIGSVIDTDSEPATLMLPATLTPAERSGIYTITVTGDGEPETVWRVLVTNEDATISAVEYSTVASRGDDVTVSAETDAISMQDLRWRRDGGWNPFYGGQGCSSSLSCGDDYATAGSIVVFECYKRSRYRFQEHAIMNVVVRECEHNKWGPPGCMNDCQHCINGGICSDLTGWCLCPPGFSGYHCENVHGSNVFGQNAEYRCDDSGDDNSTGCQGAMICYPNPFGCICPAGYTGLDCMETCDSGKFGANCKQECHCNDNSLCASDTGVCEGGECEPGWFGANCQLTEMRVNCRPGVYGDFCRNPCSCETEDCSVVEANCAAGCAIPWTGSACDQNTGDGIINLSYVKVNPGQVTAVRCSVIRNPPISEGDLILSLNGTPCTDCDNLNSDRSFNLTKTSMITLSTPVEVTCSVRNTDVMETTMLVPYVLPAYSTSDVLTFHDVTSTRITVRCSPWNDKNDVGDGPVIDYRIQMRENGTEVFSNESKGTDLVHQFIDLTPDTLYEFRMIRLREGQGGEGAPSNVQRQRTLCDAPGSPRNVIVTDSSESSLTIEWGMPVNLNGSIIHYQLQFRAIEKLYDQQFVVGEFGQSINVSTQGESNIYVLNGLEPSTLYEIKLFAVTSTGHGDDVSVTEGTDLYKDLQALTMLPEIDLRGTTATLTLPALNQQYASAYYIRVQKGKSTDRQKRDIDGFGNFSQNPDHYIAAEVEKNEQEMEFTIGDGETYGGYFNAPLQEETDYNAYIGIGSKAGEDVFVTWSDSIAVGPIQGSILIPILTVLVLVCLVVFVTCFVICFVVFRRYQRRRTLETGVAEYATSISLETTKTKKDEGSGGTDAHSDETPSSMYLEPSDGYIVPDQNTSVNYDINGSGIGDTDYDDVGITDTPTNSGKRTISIKRDDDYDDVGKQKHIVNDSSKANVRGRDHLPATPSTSAGRSKSPYDVDDCYEDLPITHTVEEKHLACKIKLKDLPKQLQGQHSDLDGTIGDEFKKLPDGQQHPWAVGKLKDKNPDSGILPYDHSRVKMDKDSKDLNSDYYNASYIKVQHPQTLIAAQDPDENTTDVFWKMVWMEKVDVIVNLSKALELSFQYWPGAEATCKVFGEYTIICNKSPVIDMDSSFREIMVVKGDKVHEVKLCHFLPWPACDIPLESLSLIDFIRSIKALKMKRSHPQLLVHCRNGVGATGVFIALYCLLDDLKNSKKTNKSVLSVVTNMRKDRINMVENEIQYWFLYQCLAVALLSPKITLREDDVMKMDLTKQKDQVAQEFKILQICRSYSVPHRCTAGKQQENTDKNRCATILPCDSVRAVLRTPGAFRGYTDYVNASVVNSFYATEVFITAQSPLPNTVEDFWRMVIDYDCAAIVCLNEMDQNDETIGMYWSEHGHVQHGNMLVKCINTSPTEGGISQCKLSVTSKKEKKMVTLDHYQMTGWSLDLSQIAEIVGLVGKIRAKQETNRPVVVHCMDGASRCGVFVTVLLDISRRKKKKPGSLFHTVLKLSGCNSHVIRSLDEYYLCHQLLQAFLQADENYYHQVE